MADNDREMPSQEFRDWWEKNRVDPEVAVRVEELAGQGRWEEMAEVMRGYILSREDWVQHARETWEAAKRGEFKFKTPPHDPRG